MFRPMRCTALRMSVTAVPVRFTATELAICSNRAASVGSAPTMRTTMSSVTASSDRTFRTLIAMSGKLGNSTLPELSS